jgi:hypothetical protein
VTGPHLETTTVRIVHVPAVGCELVLHNSSSRVNEPRKINALRRETNGFWRTKLRSYEIYKRSAYSRLRDHSKINSPPYPKTLGQVVEILVPYNIHHSLQPPNSQCLLNISSLRRIKSLRLPTIPKATAALPILPPIKNLRLAMTRPSQLPKESLAQRLHLDRPVPKVPMVASPRPARHARARTCHHHKRA